MNEKIKNYLIIYNQTHKKPIDSNSLLETLRYSKVIYNKEYEDGRQLFVAKINEMLIGYVFDEYDPLYCKRFGIVPDSICEMRAIIKPITVYEPIKEE